MRYEKIFVEGNTKVTIKFLKDHHSFHPSLGFIKPKKYRVVTKEEIYERILRNELIDLTNCYLEQFSLKAFHKSFSQSNKRPVIHLNSAKNAFFEMVDFSGARFAENEINFSGTYFGKGGVNFSNTKFGKGNVDFTSVRFDQGWVDFSNADFNEGNVDFSFAQFGEGNVDFSSAKFGRGRIDFYDTVFGNGSVNFSGAQFGEGGVSFKEAQFGEGYVDFSNTYFGKGRVNFSSAQFEEGKVNFSKAEFNQGDIFFVETQFGEGDVDFSDVQFGKGKADFSNIFIKSNWSFSNTEVKKIIFNYSIIYGTIDFTGRKTDLLELVLNQTKLIGQIFISPTELKLTKKLHDDSNVINCQNGTSYKSKAYQWRLLKENFRSLGQYDDEDWSYVQFKRNELLHEKKRIEKKWENIYQNFKSKYPFIPIKLLQLFWLKRFYYYFRFALKELIFQNIGYFGTSPTCIASYMWKTLVSFTCIYFILFVIGWPVIKGQNIDAFPWYKQLIYSGYHSIVTFLTIGYGDVQPANILGILLSGAEGFIGLFLMSYFTVAFVRKTLR